MGQTTEELNAEIAGTRQALAEDLDALQDKVSPSAVVQRRKEAMSSKMRGLGSRIMGTAHSATDNMSSAAGQSGGSVRDTASGIAGTAQDRVEGSPLAAGLMAFGAGVVIAGLIPASDAEARASRKVVETAKEQGAPVAEAARSAGQEMAESMRDSAGQAVQEVKETAQESAARVKDEASTSADRVRSEATQ
jgi:gas vesicle protein